MLISITCASEIKERQLMAIYAESNAENTAYFYPDETDLKRAIERVEEGFLNFLRQDFFTQDQATLWVLEEEGEWVSALRLCRVDAGENLYYLEALETRPDQRRKGYGSKLLQGVLEAMKKGEAWRLRDCVSKRNLASLKTHEACGFRIISDAGYDYLHQERDVRDYGLEYVYQGAGERAASRD